MPYLIATDEAGYGPKLGPLVIVATAWSFNGDSSLEDAFQSLREPYKDTRCGALRIDDSKRVFRRHALGPTGSIPILDEICRGAARWASLPDPLDQFSAWLKAVAKHDFDSIAADPFLSDCTTQVARDSVDDAVAADRNLISHWSSSGISLRSIRARIITPAIFNLIIDQGLNKADLLTEATCGLAFELLKNVANSEPAVIVNSDRHGGRTFYGAALQNACEDSILRVVVEGKPVSCYNLVRTADSGGKQSIDWSFTIGGDSFAPVAMSSIIAKWLRERAMGSFNQYFFERMPRGALLVPTAGYPSDANRFLQDIALAGLRKSIPDTILIRKR